MDNTGKPNENAIQKTPLDFAKAEVGVSEMPLGSNSGKRVEEYLRSVGLGKGNPWCMAFVYWCFNEYYKQLSITNPLVKTGGVLLAWNKAKEYRVVGEPRAGDIFIMDFGKGRGHTGIVTGVDSKYIYTIEGNAAPNSTTREGIAVCSKKRIKSKIKGYLRYK
jgi:hypothetical protein